MMHSDDKSKLLTEVLAQIPSNDKKNWGKLGEIVCPKCNGKIRWMRVKYNGHVRIACVTSGCIVLLS